MVHDIVGGWRAKTIWELTDAALDGNASAALEQLDRMSQAGEHPLAMFGAMAAVLRRFATAARIYQRAEKQGRPVTLRNSLVEAGVPQWPAALEKAERQIKQLGRHRAIALYRWLLETDLALKGTHSAPHRSLRTREADPAALPSGQPPAHSPAGTTHPDEPRVRREKQTPESVVSNATRKAAVLTPRLFVEWVAVCVALALPV